jgi:hypothetical protein
VALTIQADKLEELPEALRALAKEQSGKHAVAWDAMPEGWALDDVRALRKALQDERHNRSELEKKLRPFDGIEDPAAARDALEKVKAGSLKSAKDIEDFKSSLTQKFDADMKSSRAETEKLRLANRELRFQGDVIGQIAKAEGDPKYLLPIVREMARWETNGSSGTEELKFYGPDGKVLMSQRAGSADAMNAEELMGVLQKEYPAAFNRRDAGGSGASHATGGSGRRGQPTTDLSLDSLWSKSSG